LVGTAHAGGLQLTQEQESVWFCSSASSPEPHYVTGLSCTCHSFQEHQRCSHYALLLEHLGWLPAVVAETPAPQACFWCQGSGRIPNDQHERYDRCDRCGGSGVQATSPAIRPWVRYIPQGRRLLIWSGPAADLVMKWLTPVGHERGRYSW